MEEDKNISGSFGLCGLRRQHRKKTNVDRHPGLEKMKHKDLIEYAHELSCKCKEKDREILEKDRVIEKFEQCLAKMKEKGDTHIKVIGSHCQLQCGKNSVIVNTDGKDEEWFDKLIRTSQREHASLQQDSAITDVCIDAFKLANK